MIEGVSLKYKVNLGGGKDYARYSKRRSEVQLICNEVVWFLEHGDIGLLSGGLFYELTGGASIFAPCGKNTRIE